MSMSEFARVAGAATASLSPRELSQMSHTPRNSNTDSNRSTPPTPQTAAHMHLDTKRLHLHGVSPLSATDGFSFSQSQGSEGSEESNILTAGFSTGADDADQTWSGTIDPDEPTLDTGSGASKPTPSLIIVVPVEDKSQQGLLDTEHMVKTEIEQRAHSWLKDSAGDVADWRVEDVCNWLSNQMNLPQYASAFRELGIDGGMLLHDLTDEDLDVLQVNDNHHRKVIMKNISVWRKAD